MNQGPSNTKNNGSVRWANTYGGELNDTIKGTSFISDYLKLYILGDFQSKLFSMNGRLVSNNDTDLSSQTRDGYGTIVQSNNGSSFEYSLWGELGTNTSLDTVNLLASTGTQLSQHLATLHSMERLLL